MSYQPFLIAPFKVGLDRDMEPWLLPQDAFTEIKNAHIRHGYVEKRSGYEYLANLVHNNGSNWDISAITQADPGVVTVTNTAGLSDDNEIEIRNVSGMTQVNNQRYFLANTTGTTFELKDSSGNNVDTSGFSAYTSGGEVYLIPKNRVMGLLNYVDGSNVRQLLAFDTKRACIYNQANENFDPLDTSDIFTSGNTDFLWGANWSSAAGTSATLLSRLYFTNGKPKPVGATDGIRYYDPASSTTATTQYNPNINSSVSSVEIRGCKLIFALKGRLVLLYTYEGANSYPQRARWCQSQNPNSATAWDDNVAGRGGFVDAPTNDQIISARQIQNFLVVQFTNSVWNLKANSNPALPFVWEKVNDFRACDGKMASTAFDQYVVSAGIRGIVASDSVQTKRIDDRISLFVKEEINQDEFDKTFMQRSYGQQRTWMLYSAKEDTDPESALIYDEESSAFSTYDISMNVLGYGAVSKDYRASDFTDEAAAAGELPLTALEAGEATAQDFFWDLGDQVFLGGDREGAVYRLESGDDDAGGSIASSLTSAAWNPFKEQGISCRLGYMDLFITTHQRTLLNFYFYKNNENNYYQTATLNCLADVKEVAQIVGIQKKAPATDGVTVQAPGHGLSTGDEVYIYVVSGMDSINGGPYEITVVDENTFDIEVDSTNFGAYTTGGVVCLLPNAFTKVWKKGLYWRHRLSTSSENRI